jgi:hypothetical protein
VQAPLQLIYLSRLPFVEASNTLFITSPKNNL